MTTATGKKSWSDRLAQGMEFLAPLFDQPHLASVRDGFAALMPLIIIGALVLIILQFPCSLERGSECYLGDTPFFVESGLADKLWVPFNITFGLLSVYVTLSISYALARRRGLDPVLPVIFTFLSFLLVASPQIAEAPSDAGVAGKPKKKKKRRPGGLAGQPGPGGDDADWEKASSWLRWKATKAPWSVFGSPSRLTIASSTTSFDGREGLLRT